MQEGWNGLDLGKALEAIPTLLHDDAQRQGRLTLVTDQEGGGILVASAHLRDVRKLEVTPACHDGRVGDLLEIVIRAARRTKTCGPLASIDPAGVTAFW